MGSIENTHPKTVRYPAPGERWYLADEPDTRQEHPWLSVLVTKVEEAHRPDWSPLTVKYIDFEESQKDHLEPVPTPLELTMATFMFIHKFVPELPAWQKETFLQELHAERAGQEIAEGSRWSGDGFDVIVTKVYSDNSSGRWVDVKAAHPFTITLTRRTYTRDDFLELFARTEETVEVPLLVAVGTEWENTVAGFHVVVLDVTETGIIFSHIDDGEMDDQRSMSHDEFRRVFQPYVPTTRHGFAPLRKNATPYDPGTSRVRVDPSLSLVADTSPNAARDMLELAIRGDAQAAGLLKAALHRGVHALQFKDQALLINGHEHVIPDPDEAAWQPVIDRLMNGEPGAASGLLELIAERQKAMGIELSEVKDDELNRINKLIGHLELRRSRLGYADPSVLPKGKARFMLEVNGEKWGCQIDDPGKIDPRSFGLMAQRTFAGAVYDIGRDEAPMANKLVD